MRILTINYFSLHSRKNQSVASRCKLWFRGQYLVCFGSFRSKMLRNSQYCHIFVWFLLSNDVLRGSLGCLGCTRLIDKQSRCVNYFGTAFFGFVAWKQTAFLLMTNLPIFIEWIENPILLDISCDCKNISFFGERSKIFGFIYRFNLLGTLSKRRQIDLTDFWYIWSKFWFYLAKPNFLGELKESWKKSILFDIFFKHNIWNLTMKVIKLLN